MVESEWDAVKLPLVVAIKALPMDGQSIAWSLRHHTEVVWRELDALPFASPWPWYPDTLPHIGLGRPDEDIRAWFAGEPKGQEVAAFRDTVMAIGRDRQILQPLTVDTVRTLSRPLTIGVLTTPG